MELILKTTGKCNFSCNFCMAAKADIYHMSGYVEPDICQIIDILKPDCIIANGGEPLLSGKDFFEDLLTKFDGELAIVSNLKLFYQDPDTWTSLFKNSRVSITTSFQYGSGRKWDCNSIYDEQTFRSVMKLFKDKVGYLPMFIAVISDENLNDALKHIELAKELGTICKLNPLMPMGRSTLSFPLYRMIDLWLKIKELDLEKYTDANVQFYNGGCAFNTRMVCDSSIRVLYLDKNKNVKYGHCESLAMQGIFTEVDKVRPIPVCAKFKINDLLHKECISCKLCRLCNSCTMSREVSRKDPNHCSEMKKRMDAIINSGWCI